MYKIWLLKKMISVIYLYPCFVISYRGKRDFQNKERYNDDELRW